MHGDPVQIRLRGPAPDSGARGREKGHTGAICHESAGGHSVECPNAASGHRKRVAV